ncbi:PREDICTED: probable fructokinase-4 isoform X2 [Tarenaya hassleriana]|uniref:probable fructokinase-4 isoform X2 n=1 Tax=Tarenaya hassleriana TaxID=28532 RepID=UPI00053C2765|nr:PREDICTED: probable fructokinase-4 isoform X2 [Tarenaya hassleriana]
MHQHAIACKFHPSFPHHALSLPIFSLQSPNSRLLSFFPSSPRRQRVNTSVFLRCRSSATADVSPVRYDSSVGSGGDRISENSRGVFLAEKPIDVATLGNLCVDIVLGVPELPPPSRRDREAFMDKFSASPPDKKYWEAGGNCNMAIAAARLGLKCVAIGHVGDEIYGEFLLDVLQEEGIDMVEMRREKSAMDPRPKYQTLLCWVLVDSLQRHAFCSPADYYQEPAFNWITDLSDEVKTAIRQSKVLFCNGYDFDELSPSFITSTIDYATQVGTYIFFDPGPRGNSLANGTPEKQKALVHLLRMSDVLLLTSEEAEALTGIRNPVQAGQQILRSGKRTKWVIVKMGSKGSILITTSSVSLAPAFKVDIIDTVGCGDSFVAAIALGFIRNMPLVNTLTIANAVGAATAMGSGAGRNVARRQQVIDLMKASKLNDDHDICKELLSENLDCSNVTLLSKGVINGSSSSSSRVERVSMEKVVSELLTELELERFSMKVSSPC